MDNKSDFWDLANYAYEMVIAFNSDGTIYFANKEAEKLLQYEDYLGNHKINEIFPGEFTVNDGKFFCVSKDSENVHTMAYRGNRTCFDVELRFHEFEGKTVCHALNIAEKVYYEKKASHSNQEVEEAQQVKSQFVANVTHELRTPVNGILGNTKELLEMETDSEKLKRLQLIERGCRDMHAIINNIMDFSKLNSGKFILETAKYNFYEMIEYIRSTHINKITEKGLNFSINVSQNIPEYVIGDELRLQQIINNLISNAVKFTYSGKISLEVFKTAQINNKIELFFMVIDSGIGIAREDQDKLFKSFSQVEASTTRKFGGTGLGLCISKQLVEMMEGNIHVESEKGKGSMFSFHIWVTIPDEDVVNSSSTMQSFDINLPTLDNFSETGKMLEYGTKENIGEINKKLSKLILCVDMDNWEKAEFFMESIKQLTADAPREIKSATLKLKMAVQRGDADKTSEAYDNMTELLSQM